MIFLVPFSEEPMDFEESKDDEEEEELEEEESDQMSKDDTDTESDSSDSDTEGKKCGSNLHFNIKSMYTFDLTVYVL